MGEGDWAAPLAAADPDYVATEEDRELLVEVAEFIDDLLDEGLGGGYLELPSDCPAAPDTDGDTDGVAPEAPTTAPEVPAVVQTDGAALETPAPLAPVGLGLLARAGQAGVQSLTGAHVRPQAHRNVVGDDLDDAAQKIVAAVKKAA